MIVQLLGAIPGTLQGGRILELQVLSRHFLWPLGHSGLPRLKLVAPGARGTFVPIVNFRVICLIWTKFVLLFFFFAFVLFDYVFRILLGLVLMTFKLITTFHRRLVVPTDHCSPVCQYLSKTAVLANIRPRCGHYSPHSDAFKFSMFIVL